MHRELWPSNNNVLQQTEAIQLIIFKSKLAILGGGGLPNYISRKILLVITFYATFSEFIKVIDTPEKKPMI